MLAETAGIRRVLVPPAPGTLSALGALAADLRRDTMRTVLFPLEDSFWPDLEAVFRELHDEATAALAEMSGHGTAETTLAADMRYLGQSYELTVPVPANVLTGGAPALAALFHAAHEESFGHNDPTAPVEVVSLRAAARRPAPPLTMPRQPATPHEVAPESRIRITLDGTEREAGLYRRDALRPGGRLAGPAIVTQADCTVLIPGGWAAITDELGNLVMEHG
jgi:N-methylhydantoinase A